MNEPSVNETSINETSINELSVNESTMKEPTYELGAAIPLRVGELFFKGAPIATEWEWPHGAQRVSLAQVLQDVRPDLEGDVTAVQHCDLRYDNHGAQACWWLQPHSAAQRCTVNGKLLAQGVSQRLCHGDAFELGLLRGVFYMESRESQDMGLHQPMGSIQEVALDLTDLEADDSSGLMGEVQRELRAHRSLGDLVGDVDRPDLEPLTTQPAQARPTGVTSELKPAIGVQPVSGSKLPAASGLADSDIADPRQDNPLQLLHERYLSHLLNPLASTEAWAETDSQHSAKGGEDPLGYWMSQTLDNKGLGDVVHTAQTIDDLLEGLDDLGEGGDVLRANDMGKAEDVQDVLTLFAPPATQSAINERRRLGLGLPPLTRAEHHSVSLDSPMPSSAHARAHPPTHKDPT